MNRTKVIIILKNVVMLIALLNSQHFGQYKTEKHQDVYSLQDLYKGSDHIIISKTEAVLSDFSPDKRHIYSEVQLRVLEVFKGNLGINEKISFKTYGGTVNDISIYAVGLPVFNLNQHNLLFLAEKETENSTRKYLTICKAAQGKFEVLATKSNIQLFRNSDYPLPEWIGGSDLLINKTVGLDQFVKKLNTLKERSIK